MLKWTVYHDILKTNLICKKKYLKTIDKNRSNLQPIINKYMIKSRKMETKSNWNSTFSSNWTQLEYSLVNCSS